MKVNTRRWAGFAAGLGAAALLSGTSASPARAEEAWAPENFSLDALVEAARAEPPITVYDSTGKIVEIADAFTEKYGVKATGSKVSSGAQIELLVREGQAGNIVGDVSVVQDVPPAMAQLFPQGLVESWLPPDLAKSIPEALQDPLVVVSSPNIWAYNTEVYDKCPVDNIWALTDKAWTRKIAFQDPLGKPSYTDWFNQMEMHHDAAVAAAYEAYYGKPLETDEASATRAWVKAIAQNAPLLTDSDSAAGEAVGAKGQAEPFLGLVSTAKFRDNAPDGLQLGICTGVKPFSGWMYPGIGVVSTKTDSPNAARLFLHYLMTEEGISPQTVDGKISSNTEVPMHPDEPSGVGEILDQLMPYALSTALQDFDLRQDWQDFWRVNYTR
ncbi:ABC transporter substrate-binding protein [Chelativorans sp. J32]|uniref:ABC transporter substrate-binding protein n=1 Tax=Chelativorans sp. J32 TaxID=935840 RepID=UPI0004B8EAC7|nr:ABC transporter substrate-binding protein [Chelativorans sp. J32]